MEELPVRPSRSAFLVLVTDRQPLRPTAQPREPFEAGPRKTTSAPNKDVIFIGLDEEITEKEVSAMIHRLRQQTC